METRYFEIVLHKTHDINYAEVRGREALRGERRIRLGCDMERAREAWKRGIAHPWVYQVYPVESHDELIEAQIEIALTHECLHILCAQLAPEGSVKIGGWERDIQELAGCGVDFIDYMEHISSV